jgi:hypothetical protein
MHPVWSSHTAPLHIQPEARTLVVPGTEESRGAQARDSNREFQLDARSTAFQNNLQQPLPAIAYGKTRRERSGARVRLTQ